MIIRIGEQDPSSVAAATSSGFRLAAPGLFRFARNLTLRKRLNFIHSARMGATIS
jgi:hypothetical protein